MLSLTHADVRNRMSEVHSARKKPALQFMAEEVPSGRKMRIWAFQDPREISHLRMRKGGSLQFLGVCGSPLNREKVTAEFSKEMSYECNVVEELFFKLNTHEAEAYRRVLGHEVFAHCEKWSPFCRRNNRKDPGARLNKYPYPGPTGQYFF